MGFTRRSTDGGSNTPIRHLSTHANVMQVSLAALAVGGTASQSAHRRAHSTQVITATAHRGSVVQVAAKTEDRAMVIGGECGCLF